MTGRARLPLGVELRQRYAELMSSQRLIQLRSSRTGRALPHTRSASGDTNVGQDGRPSGHSLVVESERLSWLHLWWRTAVPGTLFLLLYFGSYELFEDFFLQDATTSQLHTYHVIRGSSASVLLATWAFFTVNRLRVSVERALAGNVRELEQKVRERTRELEEAQSFTELLFDSLRERIVVLDEAGRVVKANRVAIENAGQSLVGERCSDVFMGCISNGGCVAVGAFPRAEAHQITGKIRPDNSGRLWEVECVPVQNAAGTVHLMLEVGRDVTQQKSLEAQLLHQEKMAGLGVLTAGFAHDLGNPLASLSSELELLDDEDDMGRIRASLAVLRGHVGRINRTLREMVDFARRRRDELVDVSVGAVLADAARLVCHDRRWRRVDLDIDIPSALPTVRIVEDHLLLVFINLMLNAADAMPDGGRLHVCGREDCGDVVLTFQDTGVGMTPEILHQAMNPLFTTKGATGGTGLGLSVSSDVIHAASGALTLESAAGQGTTVTIRLPAVDADRVSRAPDDVMEAARG